MNEHDEEQRRQWHIDRTIPLAIVVTIIAQTLIGTWWMSSFAALTTNRLENIEARQKITDAIPERMARQESQIDAAVVMLKDIKNDVRDLSKSKSSK